MRQLGDAAGRPRLLGRGCQRLLVLSAVILALLAASAESSPLADGDLVQYLDLSGFADASVAVEAVKADVDGDEDNEASTTQATTTNKIKTKRQKKVVPRRGVAKSNNDSSSSSAASSSTSDDLSNNRPVLGNPNKGRLFRARKPGNDLKEKHDGPNAGKPMNLKVSGLIKCVGLIKTK
jgi:hypothetical protein